VLENRESRHELSEEKGELDGRSRLGREEKAEGTGKPGSPIFGKRGSGQKPEQEAAVDEAKGLGHPPNISTILQLKQAKTV